MNETPKDDGKAGGSVQQPEPSQMNSSKDDELRAAQARRAAILARRRQLAQAAAKSQGAKQMVDPAPTTGGALGGYQATAGIKIPGKRKSRSGWLFFLIVLLPTLAVGVYYVKYASEQFQSETRFAVRGTTRPQLDLLALVGMPGSVSQTADAYIVVNYIKSIQILHDMQSELGIDVRKYFSGQQIDPLYRVNENMPLEEFLDYWNWMIDADFNSTTAIATFHANAFSAKDASELSDSVLSLSSKLVNEISKDARTQLIANAVSEVERTEKRLKEVRTTIRQFRDKLQALDPAQTATAEQEVLTALTKDMLEMKARRTALLAAVGSNSPSLRAIERRIAALEAEITAQREQFGSGGKATVDRSLSDTAGEYAEMQNELEFAEKAYRSALSALETSQAEARRQERYFAVVVKPTLPAVAVYPKRIANTVIAFCCLVLLYLIVYLGIQAIRDHSA